MTDRTELNAAAETVASALAGVLGLGDEAAASTEWPVEDGDTVLRAPLGGDVDGELVLAVNDDVARRLLAEGTALEQAVRDAAAALGEALGCTVTAGAAAAGGTARPAAIAAVTDQGQLTAIAGLDLVDRRVPVDGGGPTGDAPAVTGYEATELGEASGATTSAAAGRGSHDPDLHALADLGALSVLRDVEMIVTAELGRTTMPMRELLGLAPGMVVEIDRAAGAPIDLLVNGRRIATGEVVVIDEEFGIRITEISPGPEQRR